MLVFLNYYRVRKLLCKESMRYKFGRKRSHIIRRKARMRYRSGGRDQREPEEKKREWEERERWLIVEVGFVEREMLRGQVW